MTFFFFFVPPTEAKTEANCFWASVGFNPGGRDDSDETVVFVVFLTLIFDDWTDELEVTVFLVEVTVFIANSSSDEAASMVTWAVEVALPS